MKFISSKKYGSAVQYYQKANKDISYYITYKNESNKLLRVKIGNKSDGITEPYCYQKRAEIVNKQRLGEDLPKLATRKKEKVITFEEITNLYFDYIKLHGSKRALSDYTSVYNTHLKEPFANKDIKAISEIEFENIQREKSQILAPKTINHITNLAKTIYNYAINKKVFTSVNPLTYIKPLKIDNNRERYLEEYEVHKLFDKIQNDEILYLFTKLALSTGGRLSTILNISKKDINFTQKIITLKDIKNNSTYSGFFNEDIKKLLIKKVENIGINDYVVSIDGTKLTDRQLQSKLKPILDKLFNKGLKIRDSKNRVVIHTLRHTFASHLAIKGTPIYTIQKLMNHKDIDQTLRYAKLAPDSGREMVEGLYV